MTSIYLMFAPLHFKCKIGISKDTDYRRKRIDDTVAGKVYVVISRKVFWARAFEVFLHVVFRLFRSPIKGASGGTEFFWALPVLPFAFIFILFYEVICVLILAGAIYLMIT